MWYRFCWNTPTLLEMAPLSRKSTWRPQLADFEHIKSKSGELWIFQYVMLLKSYAKWFIVNIAFSLTLSVILHLLAMDTGPRWPYLMRPKLINSGDDKNFSKWGEGRHLPLPLSIGHSLRRRPVHQSTRVKDPEIRYELFPSDFVQVRHMAAGVALCLYVGGYRRGDVHLV